MADAIVLHGVPQASGHFRAMSIASVPAAQKAALQAAFHLQGYMQREMLSGQRLNVISDELRGGFRVREAHRELDSVGAISGTNVRYAPTHEFGFDGTVTVKSHPREIRQKPKRKKSIRVATVARAGAKRPKAPTQIVQVRQHSRQMHLRARRYMADTIAFEGDRALKLAAVLYSKFLRGG